MPEKNQPEKSNPSPPVEVVDATGAQKTIASTTVVTTDTESGLTPAEMQSLKETPIDDSPDEGDSVQVVDSAAPIVVEPTINASRSAWGVGFEILKLFLIPILIVAAFAAGIAMIGVAQRNDWIVSDNGDGSSQAGMAVDEGASDVSYICPMMCVPPTNKPGRCPVCAMELVPAASGSSSGPSSTIEIDPRSRRVAGIQTTAAKTDTLYREVRGVGEISYDESTLKTLSAYIDGRIEELYADYTGVTVKKGDKLAMLYSPDLYSAQAEYVRSMEFSNKSTASNSRIGDSNRRMLSSSRTRLIELGMTEDQVTNLEQTKAPARTIGLYAPMSGTVIEMMTKTGQYIKAGTPVYKLADLSTVWLVLELFPEDARLIQLGQKVTATTKSNAQGQTEGTVEFVEPTVDPKMRTVGVRISIKNENGELKPGEFARATIKIPLLSEDGEAQPTVLIPRNSLLSVGQTSIVYVEGKPGVFEIRRVKTGPTVDGMVAVFEGIEAGENVVSKSTFLLDAQMQLQGNPSLIDPDKAVADDESQLTEAEQEEIRKSFEPLSEADRKLAKAQVICPVTEVRLGSMGTPIKLEIEGRTVFVCCEGCRDGLVNDPAKYFKILDDYAAGNSGKQPAPLNDRSAMPAMDLPTMDLPTMDLPTMDLPTMELPK
ncbi:efflux RND transporter periplasmic adaptor subunit [Mariniblastus sp.]|nr:efflux RND transporter periplasmic adaptor subunit [Mariniblastus sp.]